MSFGVICRGMNTRDDFINQDISRTKVCLVYGNMFLREHWASVFGLEFECDCVLTIQLSLTSFVMECSLRRRLMCRDLMRRQIRKQVMINFHDLR